jgi:1,2-phenylacetyl-CoA epoxidase catalytic subunit
MGYIHVRNAIERDGAAARQYAQKRMNEYWYPQFMASFGDDVSRNNVEWRRWGLKALTNAQMRDAFDMEMRQVNDSIGLETPDKDAALDRGLEMAKKIKAEMSGAARARA